MSWEISLAVLIGGLLLLMSMGMPVAFAFFTVNILGAIYFLGGEAGIMQSLRSAHDAVAQFSLSPIPMFVLMGELMFHTGLASRAIGALDRLIAKVPGRLSLLAITGGTMFSALSGSTIANTALLGSNLLPEMYKRGYKPVISIGPIAAVGGIAMLIPPSALGVLLGSLAKVPINDVLIGGIIPGLLLAAVFFAYVVIRCMISPDIAPAYEMEKMSWRDRVRPLMVDVLPMFGIFIVVVGSMLGGVATPTEAAGLGVVAVLIAGLCYRKLSVQAIRKSLKGTLDLSAMLLFIIAGSLTFSQILAFSGGARGIATLVNAMQLTPFTILLGMVIVVIILGCFMDQISIMMITLPLFLPIIASAGIDPLWFAILMLVGLELGLITPPFGMALFVMQGVAPPGTTLRQIYASVTPFILLELVVIGLMMLFPAISTWLPRVTG
jgi:tripartite ATP-independent transporter DctM subunit